MTPMEPLNLKLLFATDEETRSMRPIKVLDITDGMTANFHPDGLFSTEIFGKKGGAFRNRLFSYIDLRVPIIHPTLYKAIVRMKGLYSDIMAGKAYAVFDKETKDFLPSTILDGETGYHFFVSHLHELVFENRKAESRKIGIKLIQKYMPKVFITKLLVVPAGIRDYEIDPSGRPSEDELNTLYRRVMKLCLNLENMNTGKNLEFLDGTRNNLQNAIMDVYQHFVEMLRGKKKAIRAHWGTRRIVNSTRNVITSYIPKVTEIGGDRSVSPNQTVVGMYQFMRAAIPFIVRSIRENFSAKVFPSPNSPAVLINKKTLKKELVELDLKYHDSWNSFDGVERILAKFGDQHTRHKVLELQDHYMMLIYDDGKNVKLVQDVDELPEGFDKAFLRPVTMTEMLYLCSYETAFTIRAFTTRYPVLGYGGIYPCGIYLASTVKANPRYVLDDFWQAKPEKAMEFPITGEKFVDSMSPNAKNLARLGADFDGDKMSLVCVWTEEARQEIDELLGTWAFYAAGGSQMAFSMDDDVIEIILQSMTKRIPV